MAGSNGWFPGPTPGSGFASCSAGKRITPTRTTGPPNPFSHFRTISPATRRGTASPRRFLRPHGRRAVPPSCAWSPPRAGSGRRSRWCGKSTGLRGNSPRRFGRSGSRTRSRCVAWRWPRIPASSPARSRRTASSPSRPWRGTTAGSRWGTNPLAGRKDSSSSTAGFRKRSRARPPGGRCACCMRQNSPAGGYRSSSPPRRAVRWSTRR
jgi:hypothetical protein